MLVLTTFELDQYVFGALHAGASGLLLKGWEPVDLINAIRIVAGGESLLPPHPSPDRGLTSIPEPTQTPAGLTELTPPDGAGISHQRWHQMAIGPVQLIVLGFNHPDFHGEIIAELERLHGEDTVRVIDAPAVHKDADGET